MISPRDPSSSPSDPSNPGSSHDPSIRTELTSYDQLSRRQISATIVGIMMALFMAALDQTIVGTAMPRIVADLQGFDLYAWTVTAYLVTSTAVVPIIGKLGDQFGRKRFVLVGAALFVGASILCGIAQTMIQLIAFRGLQGIGAGVTFSMAFTTIADLFPPARRARITGIFAAVFGLASVVGPALGGFVTDGPGWRWVFFINVPVGLVAFASLLWFYPPIRPIHRRRVQIDLLGAATLMLSVVPLLLALSWVGRDHTLTSPGVVGLLAISAAMAIVFFRVEQRAAEPIIPLALFSNPVVSVTIAATVLTSVAMYGTLLFVPLFIQAVLGTTATESGAVMTPMMLAMVLSSIGAGQLIGKIGKYRVLAIVGVGIAAIGTGLLAMVGTNASYGSIIRSMIVIGVGLGITMPVFPLAVQNAVPHDIVGVASATSQFFRTMGGAVGSAVFGALLTSRFVPSFHAALPVDVLQNIPAAALRRFENPQALLNPETASSIQQAITVPGVQGQAIAQQLLGAIRLALATALQDVFVATACVMVAATLVLFMLRDIPLRHSNRPT